MNILHLESSPGWGGQEIRIFEESKGLRKRGHNIFMAVTKNAGLIRPSREEGFIVYEVNYKKRSWFYSLFYLMYIMKKHRIDVVVTHSSNDAWLGGIAARLMGLRIVRTRHLSTAIRSGINSYVLYNKLADYVVTTCQKVVPIICNQAKQPKNCCKSIPTGVNLESIKTTPEEAQKFREKHGILPTDFLVGTVCFMRSWKGIKDFLQAAHILRDKENIKWILIGGGHIDTYRKMAIDMGLEKKVIFTGHLQRPFNAILALDLFLLLSTAHEGVSQASLQAAYLQRPLITTSTGGLDEVCLDNVTGIQVPTFSPEKVAEAIVKLQDNKELRDSMGKKAKRLVEEKFTFTTMLDNMEEVFRIVTSKTKS